MEHFEIEVKVQHIRTYTVIAEDGHQALAKYQEGRAFFDDRKTLSQNNSSLVTQEELGDTAEVYTTDVTRTLVATADGEV